MYIYKTTNLINGKFYIGKSKRKITESMNYFGSGIYLNRAIAKYGIQNFKKEILYYTTNITDLNDKEKYFIKLFNATKNGYNIAAGGNGGNTGGMHEQTKLRKRNNIINGLNEFQLQAKKGWETRKQNPKKIAKSSKKTKRKMLEKDVDGLTKYEKIGIHNSECWKNKSKEEKQLANTRIRECWKNKSKEEIDSFKKLRSKLAKQQANNRTPQQIKEHKERAKKIFTGTVSCVNILNNNKSRVAKEDYMQNPLLGAHHTYFIIEIKTKQRNYLLFNNNYKIKFSKLFKIKLQWINSCNINKLKKYGILSIDKIDITSITATRKQEFYF